jgi:hypothetical protein
MGFPFQSYAAAIKQVGTLAGWTLSVSPLRVLRLFPGGTLPAPFAIDEVTDTIEQFTARQTRETHATHVWVRFGQGTPSEVTWSTTADGSATYWDPPYNVADPPGVVVVGGATLPIDDYPPSGAWTGWTWEVINSGGRLHAPAGTTPAASTSIALTLTAAWPSVVVAIDETYPLEVHVVIDYPEVFDAATAQGLADGELARREGYPRAFTLRTARVGLLPGQTAAIDVPRLEADTSGLVTGLRLAHVGTLQVGDPWWRYDVDLLEANASRANWLTFWQQSKGAAGTGSSVTGSLPPPAPGGGGGYATWPLGGDHDAGYSGTSWQPIANACLVTPPSSMTGATWTIYATVKRLLGTGTFQLALATDAGTNVATSAVLDGDFVSAVFTAPVVPGTRYHLRGRTSDATTLYGTTGYLEAVSA